MTARLGLAADVRVRRGSFELAVALAVRPGETVAVVGPNGAGKTTLLRALAGLERLTAGRVELDDERLDVPALGRFVRPEHRSIGVVFQDYLLFPNLDVLDNVAFGLQARRQLSRRDARPAAAGWVDRFGLTGLAGHRPDQLSGGQAQRVALARALATEPGLLLLDEPLAALDAATRLDVRSELRDVLADLAVPVLLVTHDLVDALTLADRVVVVEGGRVAQTASPADIARQPRTDYVARLVGLELLTGTASGTPSGRADDDGGQGQGQGWTLRLDGGGEVSMPATVALPVAPSVLVAVRPTDVSLVSVGATDYGAGGARVRRGAVVSVEPVGERLRVTVGPPPFVRADLTPTQFAELSLRRGTEVVVVLDPITLTVYPR